jgi:rRNA maturation RNase YbeY
MGVRFSYADRKLPLKHKKLVREFIATIFLSEGRELEALNYVFCSDEYLLDMNQRFLQHDYYTDIISFDLSGGNGIVVGEIYVSVDRVLDNARELNALPGSELLRVLFHGALHLCGFGDKTKSEIVVMRNKEDQYLRLYENLIRST